MQIVKKEMKILGMGNALVDILTQLNEDSLLHKFNLPKGSMTLVDQNLSNYILTATAGLLKKKASGGSAANTIHGLSHLGLQTAFIGKVGNDEFGKFFREDMEMNNISTLLYNSITDTGRALALVSPDSERTFATYLGAAVELNAADLTTDIFENYELLYVEGYLVQNKELMEKALRLAKLKGLTTCLDLSSYNIVRDNIEFLRKIIAQYVDIIFANEEEVKSLTGFPPEVAINILAEICDIAIVKMGPEGSLIKQGTELIKVEPVDCVPLDTTGAGDLYAAGFIYGLSKNADLATCGKIGSLLAGRVIEIIGAKMDDATWDILRGQIRRDFFKI